MKPPDHGSNSGEAFDIGVHQDAQLPDDLRFRTGQSNERKIIFTKNLRQQPFLDAGITTAIFRAAATAASLNHRDVEFLLELAKT